MPIRDTVSKLAIQDGLFEEHQTEIKLILAAMTTRNESGEADLEGFEAKNRSLKFHQKQASNIEEERKTLRMLHNSLQLDFLQSVAATAKALMM